MKILGIDIVYLIIIFIVLKFLLYLVPIKIWFKAKNAEVNVSLLRLIKMRWRKCPPIIMVNAIIRAKNAGINLSIDKLEAYYLSGKNVNDILNALIEANNNNNTNKTQK